MRIFKPYLKVPLFCGGLFCSVAACAALPGSDAAHCSTASDSKAWLKNTISDALVYSSELKGAAAGVSSAQFSMEAEKGQRWPQLRAGLGTPIRNFGHGIENKNQSSPSDTSASLNMVTTLYDFGKIASSIERAGKSLEVAQESENAQRNQVAAVTLTSLMELQEYQQEVEIARRWEIRMAQLVAMMGEITLHDRGRKSELVQAQAKLLQAQTEVQRMESRIRTVQLKLSRLTGRDITLPACLRWEENSISKAAAFSGLEDHVLLRLAKAEIASEVASESAAKAARYPTLNWVVSKNTAKNSIGQENAWYTGVEVSWNLFTGGSASAMQKAAAGRITVSQMKYETQLRELVYQLNEYLFDRDALLSRAQEYAKLAITSDSVRKMFYEQWSSLGKRSLLDLLTAENDYFNHQISATSTLFSAYRANAGVLVTSSLLLEWLNGTS
ncbi:hypothetical protein NG99_23500 [Erwinia typographi]|uniref:Transporter n=1 Tax=Erwinia typographi TaxID=371042 RepID=A0A0A3ZN86_9GAMM|nr:TolC family protein [Erwinia typographi]KGT87198.1 hypothetical protein NG99_23500 [Erwinia typographi]